jgi:hypothetical protein
VYYNCSAVTIEYTVGGRRIEKQGIAMTERDSATKAGGSVPVYYI